MWALADGYQWHYACGRNKDCIDRLRERVGPQSVMDDFI